MYNNINTQNKKASLKLLLAEPALHCQIYTA